MHVAIIMNGNGEWASRQGLAPTASHAAGASALRNTVALAVEAEIKTLTVYALCTPGYDRPREEIDADLSVLGSYVRSAARTHVKQAVRLSVVGSPELRSQIMRGELDLNDPSTSKAARMHLRIAVDYSPHDNVVRSEWRRAHPDPLGSFNRQLEEIDSTALRAGAVDLLVRTGGGLCQSEFMLWEVAHARLHYVDCLWPDFTVRDLQRALVYYEVCNDFGM
jgi:undecaprenyl diphosphate synthase